MQTFRPPAIWTACSTDQEALTSSRGSPRSHSPIASLMTGAVSSISMRERVTTTSVLASMPQWTKTECPR